MAGTRPNVGLRTEPLPTGGTLEPLLGRGAALALAVVLVICAALGSLWASAPLAEALDSYALPSHWLAASPDADRPGDSLDSAGGLAEGNSVGPSAGSAAAARGRTVVPTKPAWTLVQVSDSVRAAGPRFATLIDDGRAELDQLDDPAVDDGRAARNQARWQSWGRIWRNRVEAIAGTLPPAESCAVHAAMGPACQALEQVRDGLAAVPQAGSKAEAEARLEAVAAQLDAFSNPPLEPEDAPASEEEPDSPRSPRP